MEKGLFGKTTLRLFGILGVSLLNLSGCSVVPTSEVNSPIEAPRVSYSVDRLPSVSGMWEYREGEVVYDLLLDGQGNGTYDWQQGQFETAVLTQGQWKGTWIQVGNDREGGFEAWLAEDGLSARGRWWYTRIGSDADPLEPGGEFTLERKGGPDVAHARDIGRP